MHTKISLEGEWQLQLDQNKEGYVLPFSDVITLPGTTSHAHKGTKNELIALGHLTDEYLFEGYAWYSKEMIIGDELVDKNCFLYLERTRKTTIWIDDKQIGSQDSLNTAHIYDLTGALKAGKQKITILVDNTNYPTKGGHLTSPDTQTNWNGVTGRIELQFFNESYLTGVRVDSNVKEKSLQVTATLVGTTAKTLSLSAYSFNSDAVHQVESQNFAISPGEFTLTYKLGDEALLWSEFAPNLYQLDLHVTDEAGEVIDHHELHVGLREFKADGDKFAINGQKTFLRGKHDGLIFPLTGYAPTDVEEWLRILTISKSYGINHYRFHTCCPPEAAFTAADMLGIYMEPELPFWGTITEEGEENHNEAEQVYLISEGYEMLKAFGNHPSFVMMSLGNELWGSRAKIDSILKEYKAFDDRPLYTQGSNNHQWVPEILEHEDFFCGVRFAKDRLFRGSYAMCDAPLGHVQTAVPSTMKDYDDQFVPSHLKQDEQDGQKSEGDGTIQIQYGTEAKTVSASDQSEEWIPHIPVISHEIGQYATFPNFAEIEKYRGSLKAHNFEVFRERLESKGLRHLANQYFYASGQLAAACYKEELEAAFRTRKLAGFQLLDLQDFSGQGTALVGVLDAFMDSKGMITPEEWRTFCNDAVLLARFPKYNYASGEQFTADVELSWFRGEAPDQLELHWSLASEDQLLSQGTVKAKVPSDSNYIDLGELTIQLPVMSKMTKVALRLEIAGTDIYKTYDLWVYPQIRKTRLEGIAVYHTLSDEAIKQLEQGSNVLLMPKLDTLSNAIEGFYCTDFWCYPMFRSISESMNRPIPIGTMGLLIDNTHLIFADFDSEIYSTYPWWNIIENSKSIIMDKVDHEFSPIVQTIDNFERNHKLGFLMECRIGAGNLLVCALDADKVGETIEGQQFLYSMANYVKSEEFKPQYEASVEEIKSLLS